MLVYNNYLAVLRNYLCGVFLSGYNLVARFLCQIIQVGFVLVVAGRLFKSSSGKVLKARFNHFNAYFIVVVSACLMSIEGGGSGMVEVYRGDDSNLPALLLMKLFGNGFVFDCSGFIGIDHARIGLVAGCNGCCSRSRIGSEAAGIICNSRTRNIKFHKVKLLGTVQLGTVSLFYAWLSLHIVGIVYSS